MSDAGGYDYERAYGSSDGVIHVDASRTPYFSVPEAGEGYSFGVGYGGAFAGVTTDTQIDLNEVAFRSAMNTNSAGETSLDAFVRGAQGGYAGVLDPNQNAAYAGKLLGDAAQSFKQFGYQMIGGESADAARTAWNNGSYGIAAAKEIQAFGEAGLTLMGVGPAVSATATAGRAFAGAFSEVSEGMIGRYVDQTGLRLSMADSNGVTGVSSRLSYMGATPDKYSRTGLEVVERMRGEGSIVGDGPLLRGNPNDLQLVGPGGALTRIDANVDMAHRVDAVSWWNDVGRFYGPKAPEVRQFMLNSENYILQPSSINRSAGARLGQTYQLPAPPDFTNLKR